MYSWSRWSARRLLAAWGGYWVGLGLVALGPPAYELWALTTGHAGTVTAAVGRDDAVINVSVLRNGAAAWTGSISLVMLALWVAGPPLVMWLLWLFRRSAGPRQPREAVRPGGRSEGAVSPPR